MSNVMRELSLELRPCSPVKSMQWKSLCVDFRGSHALNRLTSPLYAVCKLHIETANQPGCASNFNQRKQDV